MVVNRSKDNKVDWSRTEQAMTDYGASSDTSKKLVLERDAAGNKYLVLHTKPVPAEQERIAYQFATDNLWALFVENRSNPGINKGLAKLSSAITVYNNSCWYTSSQVTLAACFRNFTNLSSVVARMAQRVDEIAALKLQLPYSRKERTAKELVAQFKKMRKQHAAKMTSAFFTLLFKSPPEALKLLKAPALAMHTTPFDKEAYSANLECCAGVGIMPEHDKSFAECVILLAQNTSFDKDEFATRTLFSFIQCDLAASSVAIWQTMGRGICGIQEVLSEALKWDSVGAFEAFLPFMTHVQGLAHDAAKMCAPRCLAYLSGQGMVDAVTKASIAKDAAARGQAEIVLAVCNNTPSEASAALFSGMMPLLRDIIQHPEPSPAPTTSCLSRTFRYLQKFVRDNEASKNSIVNQFIKILRFSPVHVVDQLIQSSAKNCSSEENQLIEELYARAKEAFIQSGPFIARYTKPHELKALDQIYKTWQEEVESVDTRVSNDIEYATFCRTQVAECVALVQGAALLAPSDPQFVALPASSTGSRRLAALVEKIAKARSQKQKERRGDCGNYFKELRTNDCETPIAFSYRWAAPLVKSVALFSQAPDLLFDFDSYSLMDKKGGVVVTTVYPQAPVGTLEYYPTKFLYFKEEAGRWKHGFMALETAWPVLEDHFEKILHMDLQKPHEPTPAAGKKYEGKLTEFYKMAAKLVWLIGTTQPLKRGSGTVAEWLFALVHQYHGLNTPVLKTEFPQLDVLDLIFPLSDYERLFLNFFEPSTLPKHLQKPALAPLPLLSQMARLYTSLMRK